MEIRPAEFRDLDPLARLWCDGWRDAHASIVPAELTRLRTLGSFRERLEIGLASIRVAGPPGAPLGFSMVQGDEVYQLYVSAEARGTGVAAALMADAESRIASTGFGTAWLACAIGNARAARFYEKCGWRLTGTIVVDSETSTGPFPLKVWRYEKALMPM